MSPARPRSSLSYSPTTTCSLALILPGRPSARRTPRLISPVPIPLQHSSAITTHTQSDSANQPLKKTPLRTKRLIQKPLPLPDKKILSLFSVYLPLPSVLSVLICSPLLRGLRLPFAPSLSKPPPQTTRLTPPAHPTPPPSQSPCA